MVVMMVFSLVVSMVVRRVGVMVVCLVDTMGVGSVDKRVGSLVKTTAEE